jgi:predicted component of type VI protein secretion system
MTNKLDNPTRSNSRKGTKGKPPSAGLEWSDDGTLRMDLRGDWDRIILAAGHSTVSAGLLTQAAILGSQGSKVDPAATDFVLGFVDAMAPSDPAETMLLAQMAATHQATLMFARRLNHVETIRQQDAAERALNKLARTYAAQMDTLKRYRSKGQQTVRVERVTVEEGGQAIVGNVETGGRGDDGK